MTRTVSPRWLLVWLLVLLVLVLLLSFALLGPGGTAPSHTADAVPSESAALADVRQRLAMVASNSVAVASELPAPQVPPSLADIEPTFVLSTDTDGHLVISMTLYDLFEFYLSGLHEVTVEDIYRLILQQLELQLQQPALAEATDLLQRYLGYRLAVQELETHQQPIAAGTSLDLVALEQQQRALSALRRQYLGAEAHHAFFAEDEAHAADVLQRLAEPGRPYPVPEHWPGQLTEALRLSRNDLPPEALRAERLRRLGPEVTGALEAHDRRQQQWNQRLEAAQAARQHLASAGLAPDAYQQALHELLAAEFSPQEQRRARVLLGW
ncbi:MAG: hypothetical protein LAT63_13365 [Marinobacter sp.]|nr:hypothetical protein [Marinobacter sp.]